MSVIAAALEKDASLDAAELAEIVNQKLGLQVHRRTIERALVRSKKKLR
jgi:hypothetical protein